MENFPEDFQEKDGFQRLSSLITCWKNKMKNKCKYHPDRENLMWKYCPEILQIKENEYIEDWRIPKIFF
tara:strand:- start:172 stop:378 length:207 start_codon:yes stop_codon:yes gene_type:complete